MTDDPTIMAPVEKPGRVAEFHTLDQILQAYWEIARCSAWSVVLADLDRQFGSRAMFDPENPYRMAHRCGECNVIAHILNRIDDAEYRQDHPEGTSE